MARDLKLRRVPKRKPTFLEAYDFAKAYGPIHMDLGRPVVDAVGEARSNADVFGELCARLGLLQEDEPTGPHHDPRTSDLEIA